MPMAACGTGCTGCMYANPKQKLAAAHTRTDIHTPIHIDAHVVKSGSAGHFINLQGV